MGLEVFDHYECDGKMEIEDIVPERRLTHLSLFSGIGGLDLAAEWAGFESVGQCEFADYPTKILEQHWPDVTRWRDIRTLTGGSFYERTGLRTVDIISGGFPCQPFSTAGKQRGEEDDRYLWPEMVRVIAELRPTWVVGENVAGIINMALDKVLSDLEGQGYTTRTFLIPAAGVNAPHQRYRTAIVANADRIRQFYRTDAVQPAERGKPPQPESGRCCEDVAYSYGSGCEKLHFPGITDAEGFADWGIDERTVCNTAGQGLPDWSGRTMDEQEKEQESERPNCRRGEPDRSRQWATEPRVGRVANGVSHRVDRISDFQSNSRDRNKDSKLTFSGGKRCFSWREKKAM